jgi:hypothetical protein
MRTGGMEETGSTLTPDGELEIGRKSASKKMTAADLPILTAGFRGSICAWLAQTMRPVQAGVVLGERRFAHQTRHSISNVDCLSPGR